MHRVCYREWCATLYKYQLCQVHQELNVSQSASMVYKRLNWFVEEGSARRAANLAGRHPLHASTSGTLSKMERVPAA